MERIHGDLRIDGFELGWTVITVDDIIAVVVDFIFVGVAVDERLFNLNVQFVVSIVLSTRWVIPISHHGIFQVISQNLIFVIFMLISIFFHDFVFFVDDEFVLYNLELFFKLLFFRFQFLIEVHSFLFLLKQLYVLLMWHFWINDNLIKFVVELFGAIYYTVHILLLLLFQRVNFLLFFRDIFLFQIRLFKLGQITPRWLVKYFGFNSYSIHFFKFMIIKNQ